jgi:hypothetical protein
MIIVTYPEHKNQIFVYEQGCGKQPTGKHESHPTIEDARHHLRTKHNLTDENISVVPFRKRTSQLI